MEIIKVRKLSRIAKAEPSHRSDEGQVTIFVVLTVSLFLLLFVGFGVDMTNLFLHRQMAQGAADAACVAASMDMLRNDTVGSSFGGFTAGTAYNCTASSTDAPCKYAALNGYTSPGLTAGKESNLVAISFPGSVPGAVSPDSIVSGIVSVPFVQATVTDRVKVYFASLLSGTKTQDVAALAKCGLQLVQAPVPLLVLDPRNETSVRPVGAFTIDIYGGPQKSVQINSSSSSAYSASGCSKGGFNLTQGGPSTTGSDLGITGAEAANCWVPGTTSVWSDPDTPISDPFATVCAPGQSTDCQTTVNVPPTGTVQATYSAPAPPPNAPAVTTVAGGVDGCPIGDTCSRFQHGAYPGGISLGNGKAGTAGTTGVFDPGLYYVTGGMSLASNSQVCAGTATGIYAGDGTKGTVFYFADGNSISVASNSGGGQCTNSAGASLTAANTECITGSSTLPTNMLPGQVLNGNILLAPCTGYYGDPLGTADPEGEQRGFLFFQDRSVGAVSANWNGGGAFTLAGNMYFHYCDSTTSLSGVNCNFTSGYTDVFTLGGGSGSGTYIEGNIVTDQLAMNGTPNISMDLNPASIYYILKVALLQ